MTEQPFRKWTFPYGLMTHCFRSVLIEYSTIKKTLHQVPCCPVHQNSSRNYPYHLQITIAWKWTNCWLLMNKLIKFRPNHFEVHLKFCGNARMMDLKCLTFYTWWDGKLWQMWKNWTQIGIDFIWVKSVEVLCTIRRTHTNMSEVPTTHHPSWARVDTSSARESHFTTLSCLLFNVSNN